MAERVFFSVLVPVYNVAPWLRDCLDSILDQGWERLDVVLVDDGSTDESGAICDEYAAKDSRMRVFHKPNGGLMSARRYGIERAEGDWYLFVDSDDKLLPGVFEALDKAIRESGADCVLYGIRMETPKTEWHILNPAPLCNRLITDKREILRRMIIDDSYNSLCRKCVRAACFDGRDFSPWFHISRGEDLIQSTEILENAQSFYLLPEEYYLYRFNRASITRSIRFDGYRADFTLERFFRDWLKSLDLLEESDFDRCRDAMLDRLVIELKRICRWGEDRENARAAFDSILDDGFYRDFLAQGYSAGGGGLRRGLNRVVIGLLNRRRYGALIFFCARVYRA